MKRVIKIGGTCSDDEESNRRKKRLMPVYYESQKTHCFCCGDSDTEDGQVV